MHGTFFVLGESVEGREEILARTIAEGHEIGNHTFSHPHALDLDDGELAARDRPLPAARWADRPAVFRPPHGEDPVRCARIAAERGIPTTALWSVDPSDWLERSSSEPSRGSCCARCGRGRSSTCTTAGRGARRPTATARRPSRRLRSVLPELAARGFRGVTVSELLAA